IRTPRFGFVSCPLIRLGELLGRAAAIRGLTEHGGVAIAVGLERYVMAVGSPDRESITSTEGQAPELPASFKVINPDDGVLVILRDDRDLLPIRRDAGMNVLLWRKIQRLNLSLPVDERQRLPSSNT